MATAARILSLLAIGALALSGASCERAGSDGPKIDETRPVGNVIEVAGTVTAKRASAKDSRPLDKGAAVYADDTITTAESGSVRILLSHNNAVFDLSGGQTRALRKAHAWSAKRRERNALERTGEDSTELAGRHAEKTAAETEATARQQPNGIDKPDPTPNADRIDNTAKPNDRETDDKPKPRSHGSKVDKPPKKGGKPPKKGGKPPKKGGSSSSGKDEGKDKDRNPVKKPKCDEVSCLLATNPPPCCSKYRRKNNGKSDLKSNGNSSLPAKPTRTAVRQGMGKIRGRLLACGKNRFKGKAKIHFTIAPVGRVSKVSVSGVDDPGVRSCIVRVMKGARFAKSRDGLTINYPVLFK
jgi:hypothetical protein